MIAMERDIATTEPASAAQGSLARHVRRRHAQMLAVAMETVST